MKSSITKKFRKELDQLPQAIQQQVIKAYEIWQSDPLIRIKEVFSLSELANVSKSIQ